MTAFSPSFLPDFVGVTTAHTVGGTAQTSLVISLPAGVNDGDIITLYVMSSANQRGKAIGNGFDPLDFGNLSGGTAAWVTWQVASGEPASYTLALNSGFHVAMIFVVSNSEPHDYGSVGYSIFGGNGLANNDGPPSDFGFTPSDFAIGLQTNHDNLILAGGEMMQNHSTLAHTPTLTATMDDPTDWNSVLSDLQQIGGTSHWTSLLNLWWADGDDVCTIARAIAYDDAADSHTLRTEGCWATYGWIHPALPQPFIDINGDQVDLEFPVGETFTLSVRPSSLSGGGGTIPWDHFEVDWGDATSDTLVDEFATVDHAYAAAGVYGILLRGIDDMGAYDEGLYTLTITESFDEDAPTTLDLRLVKVKESEPPYQVATRMLNDARRR